jgi:RNA polymerase sigma factor (sigma-70 family)
MDGYIRTIYRRKWLNVIRDRGRKQKRREKYIEATQEIRGFAQADEYQEEEKRIAKVVRCLNELGDECKHIIHLKLWAKKSHKEIAEILGIKAESSRVKYTRCIAKMKKCCANDPELPN